MFDSRYKNDRVLFNPDRLDIKALVLKSFEPFSVTAEESFYTVQAKNRDRLDLIAYEVYGDSTLWWAIALASGISDPLDLPIGTILRIPTFKSIQELIDVR